MHSMRKRLSLAILAICLIAGLSFAVGAPEEPEHHEDAHFETIPHIAPVTTGERLRLVATTDIIGDVLKNVAGDRADVEALISPGQNPHSYQPTPSALRAIERADIVFVNGLNLEEGLLGELPRIAKGYVVPVSAGIAAIGAPGHHDHDDDDDNDDHHGHDDEDDHHDDHQHAFGDPHVWMDPNNVIVWVENMVEVLGKADPANAQAYRSNGNRYIGELKLIDKYVRERVSTIPAHRRKFVADHDAFSYFARRYGFTVIGTIVPGTTDSAGPSAQQMARLVELIRSEEVSAIFVGRSASSSLQRLAETVASEVGRDVRILPTLTGSLAPRGEEGETYLGFLKHNAAQVFAGLEE